MLASQRSEVCERNTRVDVRAGCEHCDSDTDGLDHDWNYVNRSQRYEASIAQCTQKLNSSQTTHDGVPLNIETY